MERTYSASLAKRRKDSERYWREPQVRLRKVNRLRERRGKPLVQSVEEIGAGNG